MIELKFSVARKNINPVALCSLAGYFNLRIWDKILDHLEVRVFAINCDGKICLIIQFDLVTVPQTLADSIYAQLESICKVSKNNIIITATHTHTAPEVRMGKPGYDKSYTEMIVSKTIAAVKEAFERFEKGSVFIAKAENSKLAFNRRYWMKNGSVVTNPGKLNPDIDRPEGKIDPEISIIGIKDTAGKLKVIIANIVNHADTISGNSVSGDWPGLLRSEIESHIGSGSMFIPLIGCSGNINHFDVSIEDEQFSYSEAKRIAAGYAETIKKKMPELIEQRIDSFKISSYELSIEAGCVNDEEISEAKKTLEKYKDIPDAENGAELHSVDLAKKTPAALKYFANELLKSADDTEDRIFRLTSISLGNIRIISLPAEPFVETGLYIKENIFPDEFTLIASHSNGTGHSNVAGGYIPNKWNYDRGGYETTQRSNPFSKDTSEKILKAIEAMKEV